MKGILCIILFVCSIPAFCETFSIATLNWPPYIGEKLKNNGPVAEIIKKAFKSQGHKVVLSFFPWTRTVASSKKDSFAGMIPEYYSKERVEDYTLVDIQISGPLVFCKRKNFNLFNKYSGNLQELVPYRIGVVSGYINTEEFDHAQFLIKDHASDDLSNLEKLLKKRVDLIVIDKNVGNYLVEVNKRLSMLKLDCLTPPLNMNKLFFAIYQKNPKHDQIKEISEKGIKEIKNEIPQILKNHGL